MINKLEEFQITLKEFYERTYIGDSEESILAALENTITRPDRVLVVETEYENHTFMVIADISMDNIISYFYICDEEYIGMDSYYEDTAIEKLRESDVDEWNKVVFNKWKEANPDVYYLDDNRTITIEQIEKALRDRYGWGAFEWESGVFNNHVWFSIEEVMKTILWSLEEREDSE